VSCLNLEIDLDLNLYLNLDLNFGFWKWIGNVVLGFIFLDFKYIFFKNNNNSGRFGPKPSRIIRYSPIINSRRFGFKPSVNYGRFGSKPSIIFTDSLSPNRPYILTDGFTRTVRIFLRMVLVKPSIKDYGRFTNNRPQIVLPTHYSGRF
jgi:hypothetical protein